MNEDIDEERELERYKITKNDINDHNKCKLKCLKSHF